MTNQLRVGILGLRHLHPASYLPLFAQVDGTTVVAAADTDEAVRAAFQQEHGIATHESWEALLDREHIDLAVIFLPHVEMPDAAFACAEKGIHLIVEKPMASTSEGAERLVDACRAAGVKLSTPYLWRYHPVARQMKELHDAGILGQPVGGEGRCAAGRLGRYIDGKAEWMLQRRLSGGGPMYNLGVHWIDLYRWILDDEVAEVVGRNVKINQEYDIEDNSFAILSFSKGACIALDISYTVPDSYPHGRDLQLSLRGTQGVLSWSPSFEGVRETLFVCSDAAEYASAPRRHLDFELQSAPGYCGILGVHFLRDFVDCIRNDRPVAITGDDGVKALKVVEAIYESAQTGMAIKVEP